MSLNYISCLYALKNQSNTAFCYYKEMNRISSQNTKLNYDYFINTKQHNLIYIIVGDFKKVIRDNLKISEQIDYYILHNKNLSKEKIKNLNEVKISHYVDVINCYSYQKKLDSSLYYINLLKKYEEQGFRLPSGIWSQQVGYLILKNKYDDAIAKIDEFHKKYISGSKTDEFKALFYLAVCYERKKDYKTSLKYCEKALQNKTLVYSFANFELELYKIAAYDAEILGEREKYNKYAHHYMEMAQKYNYQSKAEFIAKLCDVDMVKPLNFELKTEKKRNNYLLYTICFLLFISIGLIYFNFKKIRKERKLFENIISEIRSEEENITSPHSDVEIKDSIQENSADLPKLKISDEAEKRILQGLDDFEKNELFLSPSISLNSLASNLNTNASYVSNVIRTKKGTTFNAYVNELRINYIILKLSTNPEYLNYKIAYLAKECGFSSYEVFTRIFTKQIGIVPSKFINLLKESQKK
ncbi:helix-turn-helix domain-containing protein [Chryseobacterium sp. GMJ5]|uniref:Helix-turn-helix domain-containing protein n=1 Tax=Chryseobacterium gilvum TaxID=2976534 RepID=A0ABT2VX32_9FLAO|nr:helix-turn-helix domain-containing protein [Chryseobacterium gilvum]MCU7613472.1 helix-turn-helix domain-containing protein [Chryseobacterium gilvum]